MFRSVSSYDKAYKGLDNSMGANNCFLNVVIQSLWHLASFRTLFKDLTLHKHKKRKKITKDCPGESIPVDSAYPSMGGYPSIENNGTTSYPSIDPLPGYPSFDGGISSMTVPTAKPSNSSGLMGYPSVNGYPDPGAMSVPSGSISKPAYTKLDSAAYPSLDGVSATKFHEEFKSGYSKAKTLVPSSKIVYPSFDDSGNINCEEYEPTSSTQMPYGSKNFSKPELKELTLEESCLF